MIGLLRGVVLKAAPETLILDVGGVGYQVRVPLSTYYEVEKRAPEGEVELLIHTVVREDAIELFGFFTPEEKALFEKLIGVSGIGPRLAQVVLSGMAPGDLLESLRAGDVIRLTRVPGVGKKTAERMVLELREAAHQLVTALPPAQQGAPGVERDLLEALVNLGYRPAQAERAASSTCREHPDAELPELLRLSLRQLSGL